MVLASAGYEVMEATDLDEVKKILSAWPIDLLVLCHSLSDADCEEVSNELNARPRPKTLVLTAGPSGCSTATVGEVLDAREGPAKLLSTVKRLFCRECSDKVAANILFASK